MISHDISNRLGERIDHSFHPGTRSQSLVILGHGLTGKKDRPLLVALATGLAERGWPCLRISYSGNGGSGGRFEDSNITKGVSDLQAVLDHVPKDIKITYAGHSMGAAVGVLTAARDTRIGALVSLSGMTHTAEFVAREFGGITPGAGVMWDEAACPLSQEFVSDLIGIESTLSAVEAVTQPWLLIHGAADDVVPPQDGKDAFDAATSDKCWLEIADAGHTFSDGDYPEIIAAMDAWLAKNL